MIKTETSQELLGAPERFLGDEGILRLLTAGQFLYYNEKNSFKKERGILMSVVGI